MRFLIKLYRKLTGRGTRVHFYMKSGNVVKADVDDFKVDDFLKTSWCSPKRPFLDMEKIVIGQIEAVVIRRW